MSLKHFDRNLKTHELVQDIKWDRQLREQWERDMDSVLDAYDLTPAERRAIREHDFKALYDMGVHQYLLAQLARLIFGTDEKEGASRAASALIASFSGTSGTTE